MRTTIVGRRRGSAARGRWVDAVLEPSWLAQGPARRRFFELGVGYPDHQPEDPLPRPVFADPKTDFAFKRIFGSEEHKDVLVAFLNDMLDLDAPRRILEVELLPRERRSKLEELGRSIVDVECTDARGVTYVVEIRVLQVEGFERRLVDGVAETYVSQGVRDEPCPRFADVVGITICDFASWPNDGERGIPMLSRWCKTELHTGINRQVGLVFLELPKLDVTRPPQTMVEKWAYFFRAAGDLGAVAEVLAEQPFIDALEAASTARFTVDEEEAHILAGMAIQDKRGALAVAERRGYERGLRNSGREQGLREGLRRGIGSLCRALRIELTEDRERELAGLEIVELDAMLTRLEAAGR